MATKTTRNDLTCFICGQLYTNPIRLTSCGHTFDHQCIFKLSHCPIVTCRTRVYPHAFEVNHALKQLVDDYKRSSQRVYEIFLLDNSSSMWYSDSFLGLFGRGRFDLAVEFLRGAFEQRWNSLTSKSSLVTFDSNPLERFTFEHIREHHIQMLSNLRANGSGTALFDAIKFALNKFETLNQIVTCPLQCLYILTDGDDNFSSSGNQQQYIKYVKKNMQKLNITGHVVLVGDKNLRRAKEFSDTIDFQFHHFNQGNAKEFLQSFLLTSEQPQPMQQNNHLVNALPDACSAPFPTIIDQRRERVLA